MNDLIPGTTVRHGTITGYERCNGGGRNACADCREARRRNAARLRYRKDRGITSPADLLDIALTMQALILLHRLGHNTMAIERLTGIANQHISRIARGKQQVITRDSQERILAGLHYALLHPGWRHEPMVPSDRSWQQMRSLTALGWPMDWLCTQLGWARTTPPFRRPTMQAATAARVQELYDRLSGTKGPCQWVADRAASMGWHVPLAYDDDGRLIPEAIPNDLTRAAERREDKADRARRIAELTAQNKSAAEIAAVLGVSDRTVTRARHQKDLTA